MDWTLNPMNGTVFNYTIQIALLLVKQGGATNSGWSHIISLKN